MPQVALFNQTGAQIGEVALNDAIFGIEPHKQAMFDAVIMQRASMRQGTHKTKTRTEVRGGGRKPWKQKGTGRARQGSIRSPQWRGGGTVFGPVPRSYSYKLNKKVRRLALLSALSTKVVENEILVLDQFSLATPKTKEMVAILNSLNVTSKAVIVTTEENQEVALSARNIPGVKVLTATSINVLDLLDATKLVITKDAVQKIEEVLA
ncbi:MAG: 50S ribosomal protein L4 [Turicibacter sp.]|nr:50S ribosomal protein L4 [Turicibacter sp.]